MQNLTILNTTIRHDAEGRFCLNDFHRAAGGAEKRHGPSYWLATAQAKELIKALAIEDQSDTGKTVSPVSVVKGNLASGIAQGTYARRELVYAYAMWISAAFHLKVIRAFDMIQRHDMNLWQQMQALIAQEVESKVRASFGSHLMLERKREIPYFRNEHEQLESQIQPSLLLN